MTAGWGSTRSLRSDPPDVLDADRAPPSGCGAFSHLDSDGVNTAPHGKRPKIRRVLSDPSVSVVVVEHRDRLARFGVEYLEAALSAQGRRIVVTDQGETDDDLVRDVIEVLTSMCAGLYGRRGARNRALRAVTATTHAETTGLG